jgi:outer membrane protein assembly factor BamB
MIITRLRVIADRARRLSWESRPGMKIVHALAGAAITLVLIFGWRFFAAWHLGRVELKNADDPVIVQVLAEDSDTAIGEPFDLAARAVVELPEGDYRLWVNGKGRLGRTFRFAVNRGETLAHSVSIDDGRLLGGDLVEMDLMGYVHREVRIPFPRVIAALELKPGKASLIEWAEESLICRDSDTGKVNWDAFHPAPAFDRAHDPVPVLRKLSGHQSERRFLERADDLDGDGTRDLVCCFPGTAAFIALSGKDGSMLWSQPSEVEGASRKPGSLPETNHHADPTEELDTVVGEPAVGDLDGDGVSDFVITTASAAWRDEVEVFSAELKDDMTKKDLNRYHRAVVAISGRTGSGLWRYTIDPKGPNLVPAASVLNQSAVLMRGRRSASVAYIDGTKWLGLDPATGKLQAGPIELAWSPEGTVQYYDLDGDGEPELLAAERGPAVGQIRLRAVSIKDGRELWEQLVDEGYDQSRIGVPLADYPLILDLDSKGEVGIVVADSGAMPPGGGYRGVRLIEGRTGATRWRRPMRPQTAGKDGVAQIMAAPDLDGDGMRDLVTVSLFDGRNPPATLQAVLEEPRRVYVDAISGRDGRALWWWKLEIPAVGETRIWKPAWWGRGRDGWPLLAVPLGGPHLEGLPNQVQLDVRIPANVHLLEVSTGKEVHRVTGLARARFADLDGDGLVDLWGNSDSELRAFRGEAPEAWRALGVFRVADSTDYAVETCRDASVDFDGDGITDTLIIGVHAPGGWGNETTGTHTAVARSGRDGRTIWKTVVDPRESWLEPNSGDFYQVSAFPLPEGDFDGDGTPDVIVNRVIHPAGSKAVRRDDSKLPLKVFSGRTGARLWSAGASPLGFQTQGATWLQMYARAVEPNGKPDLFVRHTSSAGTVAVAKGKRAAIETPCLARISGRDGRVLWDVVFEEQLDAASLRPGTEIRFDDLDGDGGLDMLIGLSRSLRDRGDENTLIAISLRDGKRLWSRTTKLNWISEFTACIGDLDGDDRKEVMLADVVEREGDSPGKLRLQALDGRDGKPKWEWNAGTELVGQDEAVRLVPADFEGVGKKEVCASFQINDETRRIVVLDGRGKEKARRDVGSGRFRMLEGVDLDGDGRDELVVQVEQLLSVWDRELKDVWSYVVRGPGTVQRVVPGRRGEPGTVIVSPAVGLDGVTGKPRWVGQAPLPHSGQRSAPRILDLGNLERLPLFIGDLPRSTVCRVGMATTPEGGLRAPGGTVVKASPIIVDDPRWARPLPWVPRLKGAFGPWGFLAASGLAFVNVALPVFVLWLAGGRRRVFRIRTLMALPVAAAIPLIAFLTLAPWLPVGPERVLASEGRVFLTGTVGGVPIVLYVAWFVASVARRRWKTLLALLGLTVLATAALAGGWIWLDRKSMSTVEHYELEGWGLVVMVGGYSAAVLWGVGRGIVEMYKLVRRRAS